jgi:flagellar basal body-associated protein FliL
MAEGESESESSAPEREGRKRGARKLLVTLLPLALIALVVAKMTILEPPPAPAVVAAKAAAHRYELDTKCALANGVNAPKAPAVDGTAGSSTSAPPTAAATSSATGPTLDLDSKTMNLDGTHYLKVGVSLQLPAKAVVDDVKTGENWGSVASQLVLDTFSGRSFAELSKDGVRERLQHEIGYQTCERTGGKVTTVYFVDFVMQ